MRSFAALLLDSYRELNSKKLFWVILGISAIVVLFYGSIGFNDQGITMLFGLTSVENPLLAKGTVFSEILYRSIFSSFMVGLWLAWIATILALISTTSVFPDFVAGGSIDLVLSKPLGRVRLFLMKYLASLLFVLLQVSVFCIGTFLCMGARLGDWEWKIFAAIPVVTVFFSYLFSVNVLIGVWTRSALTALLFTMLLWFSLFSVNMAEGILNQVKTGQIVEIEERNETIERFRLQLAALPGGEDADPRASEMIERQITDREASRDDLQKVVDKLEPWHQSIRGLQASLPKTSETIGLLDRWLKRADDVNIIDIFAGNFALDEAGQARTTDASQEREVQRRMLAEYEERSVAYVIGSSLVFEAVVLALACFIFVRRDY
jgi:hypothetical protein